jgi:hypothetical protein
VADFAVDLFLVVILSKEVAAATNESKDPFLEKALARSDA